MEGFSFRTKTQHSVGVAFTKDQRKGYFRNILKSEAKRFSSLVISNAITIEDNKIYFKIFMMTLQKPAAERTEQDDLAICKILVEQNIFPQFQNDLNVLKLFARQLAVRQLAAGQHLLSPRSKDDNLYKIVKGEVSFRREEEGVAGTRRKGQFIETYEEFRMVKNFEVQCREETYFLVINYRAYEQALKLYLQNKIVLKMLLKLSLFQSLQRRQLAHLLTNSRERILACKDHFFREGESENDLLYFVIEGQIVIAKADIQNKKQIVCYLADGSLFGQELLFLQSRRRLYTASVHSSQARVIEISRAGINSMISHFGLTREQFYNNAKYREYLQRKIEHYSQKLQEAAEVKQAYRSFVCLKRTKDPKQLQISSILREAENCANRLESKEKILELRKNCLQERRVISVEAPLFARQDFPGYRHCMRRYEIEELKAKQNSCRLPHLK